MDGCGVACDYVAREHCLLGVDQHLKFSMYPLDGSLNLCANIEPRCRVVSPLRHFLIKKINKLHLTSALTANHESCFIRPGSKSFVHY